MRYNIEIQATKPIGTPNPNMWGIFYEEINHAGDGGLYAELIRNRNFAECNLPEGTSYYNGQVQTAQGHVENFDISDPLPGWRLHRGENCLAVMERTEEAPRNPAVAQQLALTVVKSGAGAVITNDGYWGIPAGKKGYHGFLIARGEGIGTLRLGLRRRSGEVLCSTELSVGSNFAKQEYRLMCAEECAKAQFFIEVCQEGRLFIDFVSLFPDDTYGGRPYGLRRDLMDMLKQLHPGFVRFPGGCVVEGISLPNAIHWKNTVGPIEDRPGHWDLWHYRCTDGLGMHEFLQLCEDLGAQAMYVVNCGMSCQARSMQPGTPDEVEQWLRDALDGIEYCIGSTDTKWGALRAQNGHPAPFDLKYVEIGNENSGPVYEERYHKFYQAIHAAYPQLTLIANCRVAGGPNDMVDDHYYTKPQQFPQLFDRYDEQEPGVGSIYVGEYACNQDVGYGNLLSAVSEAAFMVGMERNCDKVRIASYAPLFCNVNDRTWPVNLINFDNRRVFGLPSYYVQQLFALHRPQTVVQATPTCGSNDSRLFVTAGIGQDGDMIIKAACYGQADITAQICVEGFSLGGEAEQYTVAGGCGEDTNTLDDPQAVCARRAVVPIDGNSFAHTFPACSVTVLRIPAARGSF
ncbi:MAG TPA: hypothetical protein IAA58_07620 [Candidatus Gallacutalibacter stercoravium]|nr:hypothetical protein [Candidatus Gallacutalibacter stercoravium]